MQERVRGWLLGARRRDHRRAATRGRHRDALAVTRAERSAQHFGSERQQRGYPISLLALHIGSISDAVGEIGRRHQMSFTSAEYQIFNRCIDTAISAAIDQFWTEARQRAVEQNVERVGYLAHELRNALQTARVTFALLQSGQVGLNSRTAVALDRSLARLESLISQTLLSARLNAVAQLELAPLHVHRLLCEIADDAVSERGIKIHVDADRLLEVVADHRLLVSAIANLLQNAIKFSRDNGHVVMRAKQEGQEIIFEVEDECRGLPPGKADELFTPHVQRGEDRRGFGLGLAITREAVEAQQGRIWVSDLPGKGCVFRVALPITR